MRGSLRRSARSRFNLNGRPGLKGGSRTAPTRTPYYVPKRILPSGEIPGERAGKDDVAAPHTFLTLEELKEGVPAFKLFHTVGLTSSGGASRRLIQQGWTYLKWGARGCLRPVDSGKGPGRRENHPAEIREEAF